MCVRCGAVRCGAVWCGVVWCGVVVVVVVVCVCVCVCVCDSTRESCVPHIHTRARARVFVRFITDCHSLFSRCRCSVCADVAVHTFTLYKMAPSVYMQILLSTHLRISVLYSMGQSPFHGTPTRWDWDNASRPSIYQSYCMRGPWKWDTMGLAHNGTGTQQDWDTIGLGHTRTGTQRDWDIPGLGHNGTGTYRTGTQRDWDTMELGLIVC